MTPYYKLATLVLIHSTPRGGCCFVELGRVGLEPTVLPVCLIYSQVPSPLGYLPILETAVGVEPTVRRLQRRALPFGYAVIERGCYVDCGRAKIWKNFQFLPARILRINTPRTALSWCIYLPRIRTIYHPTP